MGNTSAERAAQVPQIVLSYRWGKLQGWILLAVGFPAFLIRATSSDFVGAGIALAVALTGCGLIRKRQYGLILFYIMAVGSALLAIFFDIWFSAEQFLLGPGERDWSHLEMALSLTVAFVLWWIIPAWFYYHKRKNEFTTGLF